MDGTSEEAKNSNKSLLDFSNNFFDSYDTVTASIPLQLSTVTAEILVGSAKRMMNS